MSLFTKNCLRISGIAIVVGIVLVSIALVSGVNIDGANRKDYVLDFTSDYNQDIKSLNIDLSYGEITVKRGDKFSIDAKNMNKKSFNSYVDNGVWSITDDKDNILEIFGFSFPFFYNDGKGSNHHVTICIPQDFNPERLDISVGAGKVTLCDMQADYVDFEIGAGKLETENLKSLKEASFEVGAGQLEIASFVGKDVSLDCGVGEIVINGELTGDSDVECGMGHIKIGLTLPESDYDYRLSCGLGNININGDNYSFTSDSNVYGVDAKNSMNIDCGVGGVEITNQ